MATSPLRSLTATTHNVQLGSPLGKGSYGEVRKATFGTGSPAAVKIFSQTSRRALEDEKAALTVCKGMPHCLQMRTALPNMIVSDLIPGRDLAHGRRILNFEIFTSVAKQALEFLSVLHTKNCFHGDIKTDNMMVEAAPRHLTMIDLNGGGQVGQKSSKQVMQGAPYKSPEIVLLGQATTALDIWSLGCALFRLSTGRELFPGNFITGRMINPHLFRQTFHNTPIRDNQHLHMMRDMLGMPSLAFLQTCSEPYYKYSPEAGVTFRYPLTPITDAAKWKKIEADYRAKKEGKEVQDDDWMLMETCYFKQPDWREVLRAAMTAQKVPAEKIEQAIVLIGSMVRYEGRATASELLSLPVFQDDVHFHLTLPQEFGAKSTDKIAFYRACDVQIDAIPEEAHLLIDRAVRVTRHCYHLNKDPNDQYYVVVNRGGTRVLVQPVKIVPGDRVMIKQNEDGSLSVEVNQQESVVRGLFQEHAKPEKPFAVPAPVAKRTRDDTDPHLMPSQPFAPTQINDSQDLAIEPSPKKVRVDNIPIAGEAALDSAQSSHAVPKF